MRTVAFARSEEETGAGVVPVVPPPGDGDGLGVGLAVAVAVGGPRWFERYFVARIFGPIQTVPSGAVQRTR